MFPTGFVVLYAMFLYSTMIGVLWRCCYHAVELLPLVVCCCCSVALLLCSSFYCYVGIIAFSSLVMLLLYKCRRVFHCCAVICFAVVVVAIAMTMSSLGSLLEPVNHSSYTLDGDSEQSPTK